MLRFKSVNDAALCVLIEDVESGHFKGYLDLVACSCLGTGGYTRDEVCLTDAEVEIDLCAHKLGNVNVNVECVLLGIVRCGRVADGLGTETCNNLLTDVRS